MMSACLALLRRLALASLCALAGGAVAAPSDIGVLTTRPRLQTAERWQPLADYLNATLPGQNFHIVALDRRELEAAVTRHKLGFVLTDPAHYAVLARRDGLSSPLATLINNEQQVPTMAIGGVIVVRADDQDLRGLADLRGHRIAAPSQESLGGFLAQAEVLQQAGVRVPLDIQLVDTGLPQDRAIDALLAGQADAAFVRAGVIEAMSREGRLDLARLRVVNRQQNSAFPAALSTRLFPEWPVAALADTDPQLARQLAVALLQLPADAPAAQAMQSRGFAAPPDYESVRRLLADLRLPPYEQPPAFTLGDVIRRYPWEIGGLIVSGLLLAWLTLALLVNRGVLLYRQQAATTQAEALAASEARFRSLHDMSPVGMALSRLNDRSLLQANRALCRMTGYNLEELRWIEWRTLLVGNNTREVSALISEGHFGPHERELRCRDGQRIAVRIEGVLLPDPEGDLVYSLIQDISDEKRRQQIDWELGLFTGGPVAVFIWLPTDGWPVDYVSPNVAELLGYTAEEMLSLGFRFADLIHADDRERTQAEVRHHFESGLAHFEQSYRLRHKNGEYRWFYDFTVPERGADGQLRRIRGYLFDQSRMKQVEAALDAERERLAGIIEGTNVGTWEWDILSGKLTINERWARILGYRLDELTPASIATWQTRVHPDDLAAAQDLLRRHFAGEIDYYEHESRMRHKDGHWVWVLDRGKVIRRGAVGEPLLMSGTHTDITGRKAADEEIQRLAFYDPLTALPNRRLLLDRLTQALAAGERSPLFGALLLLDLDHFKNLNDTLGHGMGDRLLVEVAERLSNSVRCGDTVARFGGDEFVVLLPNLSDNEQHAANLAEAVAEKLRDTLNQPFRFADARLESYHNTPSIGISLFLDHRQTLDTLLRQADMAMYQAKNAGRNAIRFYNPDMQAAVDIRATIEAGLRKALHDGELSLHFQPQVDNQGKLVGAEALLRWQCSETQMLTPEQFIPVAEETGLILPIGNWVLDCACATLKAWGSDDFPGRMQLAVNVSARQFHQTDFVDQVQRTIERYSIDPAQLKLELTESLVLDNIDDAIAKMRRLKATGVSFSLDDFGTGYSSLSYLKRLPIDQLKIDRSFVRDIASDPEDAAIVQAILGMSRALKLDVVAEGVESEVQRRFLHRSGCRTFQGYLFSKPLPRDEFELLLQ